MNCLAARSLLVAMFHVRIGGDVSASNHPDFLIN